MFCRIRVLGGYRDTSNRYLVYLFYKNKELSTLEPQHLTLGHSLFTFGKFSLKYFLISINFKLSVKIILIDKHAIQNNCGFQQRKEFDKFLKTQSLAFIFDKTGKILLEKESPSDNFEKFLILKGGKILNFNSETTIWDIEDVILKDLGEL